MKVSFHDFVENCKSKNTEEEAREYRLRELAKMRNRMKLTDSQGRPRLIAKLMYLAMEGENCAFGRIEIANCMAHTRFSHKWMGYVGASAFFEENCDEVLLITQTIVNDLDNSDPRIQILALSALANIGGPDLTAACLSNLQKVLESQNPRVLKAAAMAALTCIKVNPELHETFRKFVPNLLNSTEHCVVMSGINLAVGMMTLVPSLVKQWHQFSKPFIDLLRELKNTPPTKETEFHMFNDPFLQCQTLKAIGMVKRRSDELDSILQEIITDLDCHTNTGRSILLQATETIARVGKNPSLKTLAINQIGRLLGLRDPAVCYSALSAFSRLLLSDNNMINRSSSDSAAMQRYRSRIVQCLEHPDPSIRRRALDVISAIVTEQNVEKLVPEIMRYMKLVDTDFRAEIVPKVFASIQRFAPTAKWNVETVLRLVIDNGNFIGNDVITSFCRLVSDNAEIRQCALEQLEDVIGCYGVNQALVQMAAYCIGEFEARDSRVMNLLLQAAVLPKTTGATVCYILTAIAKLSVRFDKLNDGIEAMAKFISDNRIEVQQRAGEIGRILSQPQLAYEVFAPVDDESADIAAPEDARQSQVPNRPPPQHDALVDLLETEKPATASKKQRRSTASADIVAPEGSVLAFETSDVVAYFEVRVNQADKRQVAIRATYFNKGKVGLSQFYVNYGVMDGWMLKAQKPSDINLGPSAEGHSIQQVICLSNRGNSPLQMRAQLQFLFRSQPIKETVQVNDIF